jgi:hypothetical protein
VSREEDLIRSTTHAIASTVREVPPLRLEPAAEELRSPAHAPRRGRGNSGRQRRWRTWAAPVTAAAMVVALAVALVVVKDIPNDGAAPQKPAASTSAGPGGVPRYYVALKQLAGDMNSGNQRNDIVVGDSLTGKTLATLAPPAKTAFESVSAAADDRTFVVFGVRSSNGSFQATAKEATVTGVWYEVRLAPGTAHPARLTELHIKPQTVPGSYEGPAMYALINSFAVALSGSGQEIAVPEWTAPHGGLALKVYSVATGQLLHEWTANASSHLAEEPSLTWIDGDRELALVSRMQILAPNLKSVTMDVTVREWPVAGPASGDLVADSKVVWNLPAWGNPTTTLQSCVEPVVGGPVVISADGKTFSCPTAGGSGVYDHLSFHTYPLSASTTATTQGTIDYQVTFGKEQGLNSPDILWTSPSGDTLIGAFFPYDGSPAAVANGVHVGVISHGKFTPLPIPASLAASTVVDMAF